MIHSICLLFIFLGLQAGPLMSQPYQPYNATESTHHTNKAPSYAPSYDEWDEFDNEEDVVPAQPLTRWDKFMKTMDETALKLRALYLFKLKPWWKEKHGKEITIATATTLATVAAAYIAYRKLKPRIEVFKPLTGQPLNTQQEVPAPSKLSGGTATPTSTASSVPTSPRSASPPSPL